jgi:hypothetical protein
MFEFQKWNWIYILSNLFEFLQISKGLNTIWID